MTNYNNSMSSGEGSAYSDDDDFSSSQTVPSKDAKATRLENANHTALVFMCSLVVIAFIFLAFKYYSGPFRFRCKKNPPKQSEKIPLQNVKTETESLLQDDDFEV